MILVFLLWVSFFLSTPQALAQKKIDSCLSCHNQLEAGLKAPVEEWNKSIHKKAGVFCSDCHGGNPQSMENAMTKGFSFIGKPAVSQIPALCARCHSDINKMRQYNLRTDQFAEYKTSIHGKRLLEKGDPKVATCISCHGTHEIRKKDDSQSSVFHNNVPKTCAKCHSDKELMKPYNLPTNQREEYELSYHGQILLGKIPGKNPALVPNCATCHGIHGATPPGVKEVVNVCGNCHSNTANYFKESPHAQAVQTKGMPRCVDCHSNHKNTFPTLENFLGGKEISCESCHQPNSFPYGQAEKIKKAILEAETLIKGVEKNLGEVKDSGKNIEELILNLKEAKDNIIKVAPVSHSLDLGKVQNLTSEAIEKAKKVNVGVKDIKKDLKMRKQNLVVATIVIFLIIALVILKLKSLKVSSTKPGGNS